MSAKLKLKLTALEGSRVRRVGVAHFGSCRAEDYGEHHLAVLTNLGDIQVVSMPLLKPQVRYSCIRREDVSGIASCVFTKYGQGVQARTGASVSGAGLGERVSQALSRGWRGKSCSDTQLCQAGSALSDEHQRRLCPCPPGREAPPQPQELRSPGLTFSASPQVST